MFLWLSGSADFQQGAREVTLPIVRVDAGEFLGDTVAQRSIVGHVRIVSNGCNDDCRDYAAKVAANR